MDWGRAGERDSRHLVQTVLVCDVMLVKTPLLDQDAVRANAGCRKAPARRTPRFIL